MSPAPYFLTWNKQSDVPTLAVKEAQDDEFILKDGRRVYDFVSTSFQSSFGHSNQLIIQRIASQLETMPIASPKASFDLKDRVSARLLSLLGMPETPEEGGRIFYTVSGAEAVENALKIVRHFSDRKKILARHRSYHGATFGAMSVSGDWRSHSHLTFDEGTIRIPEPDDDPDAKETRRLVESSGAGDVAAIIVETISGVNGVVIPPDSWWKAITQLCDDYGILLIADEVLCGFGRTGSNFAFQETSIRPDLICMSKAITGGYFPFGAVWVSPRIAQRYDENVLACGLTNYAHPGGLAALDAVMDLLSDETLVQRKQRLEQSFQQHLSELRNHERVEAIRSRGLLAAIDLIDAAPTWTEFLDAGNYVFSKDRMIVLGPPFISTTERLSAAFRDFRAVIG